MYQDSNILENANSTPSDPAIKVIAIPLKNLIQNPKDKTALYDAWLSSL